MDTKKVTMEVRLAQWAQVMQDRASSGESIAAYCKQRGIGRHSYFYWQKKLREAAVQQLAGSKNGQQALVPSGWAQACVAEEPAPEQASVLTLRVGGAEIEVRQGFDEALLASICRALSSQC
jgi:transposase-like protein